MNDALAIQKGLIENKNKILYIKLQNLYKYLFEVYLISKINLKVYDLKIKNSNLYFGKPNPTNEQLISGLREYLNLDHIYILNNFFIEKLNISDINLLKNCLNSNKIMANQELLSMVERTYKEIIKKNYFNGEYSDKKYKVCYGVALPCNFADNDALVLKIFYSKNTKQLSDDEFIDNLIKQKEFIKNLKNIIKKEVEDKLNISCEIMEEKILN